MAEMSTPGRASRSMKDKEEMTTQHTPDVNGTAMKIERAREAYKAYAALQDKPSKGEILAWYFYELCSYFIHTVLIPVIFPLIISQIVSSQLESADGWIKNEKGLLCRKKEVQLYEGLTQRLIHVRNLNFSPLEWTSISWVTGLILACPVLGSISIHLDHGQHQPLIAAASIAIGAVFCLPTGFFRTVWIFPTYIAAIVAANTIAAASHTRHLGLMLHGYTGSIFQKSQFLNRKGVASWLSLYSTSVGCVGSAIISAFTYRMLRLEEKFISLWVVSIFSGLKWLAGIIHLFVNNRVHSDTNTSSLPSATSHILSIFRYPHAVGSLVGVFFSSFSTHCIFTGGILHLVGNLCLKPVYVLYLWLVYFIFPLFSLPLSHPLQHVIKADAVKMQLLGLLLSVGTSGVGFYFRDKDWHTNHVFLFAAIQSTSAGLLYSFGRVLLLDCSPPGKEGAFSVWLSWVRTFGGCAGFAVASAIPGNISTCLGIAFCSSIVGILVLNFSNISSFGGAIAAGHIKEDSERGSPVHGLDSGIVMKNTTLEGRTEEV